MSMLRYVLPGLICVGLPVVSVRAQAPAASTANYARLPLAFEKQAGDKQGGGLGRSIRGSRAGLCRGVGKRPDVDWGLREGRDIAGGFARIRRVAIGRRRCGPGADTAAKIDLYRQRSAKWRIGLAATHGMVTCNTETYPESAVVYPASAAAQFDTAETKGWIRKVRSAKVKMRVSSTTWCYGWKWLAVCGSACRRFIRK